MLLELGWVGVGISWLALFLFSYVVLGLVLLELGWAGVGISWLALFYPRTQHCSLPYSLRNVVLGKWKN